jgi:hypothetical protein
VELNNFCGEKMKKKKKKKKQGQKNTLKMVYTAEMKHQQSFAN